MRNVLSLALLLALLLAAGALGCGVTPGFSPDDDAAGAGPSVSVVADVAASRATLHVVAHDLPAVLGLSAHVTVDDALVAVDAAKAAALFGGAGDVRTIAAVEVSVGGQPATLELDPDPQAVSSRCNEPPRIPSRNSLA